MNHPTSVSQQVVPGQPHEMVAYAPSPVHFQRDLVQQPAEPPRSLIEVLYSRKWMIFFWVLVGAGLGVAYQQYAPIKYESRAEIVVLRANPEAPASPLSSSGLSASAPSTHKAVLLSTSVLGQALEDPALANSSLLAEVEHPLDYLQKKLDVSASDEGETVSLRFVGENPEETAALIAAVVHAYFDHQGIPVRGMSSDESDTPTTSVIDEQVIASQLMFHSQQLAEANIQVDLARSRLDRAATSEQDLNQLQQIINETGTDGRTIGFLNLLAMNSQVSQLDQQLRSMPASWGPDHRMRVQVQHEYEGLIKQYEIAEYRVRQQALAYLASLYEQAQSHRDEIEGVFTQLEAKAEQARPAPVRVIDPPRVATRKSSPIATKSYAVSLFVGFFVGCCFAVRSELRSPRLAQNAAHLHEEGVTNNEHSPTLASVRNQDDLEQIEAAAEVPLLGSVPEMRASDRLTSPNFASTASSIHQIRAMLQAQAHRKGTQSYAFTSPSRGAGKTSITVGVASSLATSGTRTLVVDCDLAGRIVRGQVGRPVSPTHIAPFGPIDREHVSPNNQSLDDIAVGQGYISDDQHRTPVELEDTPKLGIVGMLEGRSLDACVVEATVEGLWLLPASDAEPRHIGVLSDAFIRDLLEQARDRFDLVLFDTGPVPGSVEALLVTSQADGAIVVIPQGESSQKLSRTMSYLKVVGATVLGTVFNQPTPDASTNASGQDIQGDTDSIMEGVPVGSGILAAAVFADSDLGRSNNGWELKGTSEYPGQTTDADDSPEAPKPVEPSDILP